mmetsp:Transcript_59853/g.126719  ORF Transcript_59853/g.126719 Transcript_59853/m.126719 type:complete len:746 (-) Transcript_59853:282-2519(-)
MASSSYHKDGHDEQNISPSKLRQLQDAAERYVPNLDFETSEKSPTRTQSMIDQSPLSPTSEAAHKLADEEEGTLLLKAFLVFLAVVVFPMICRTWYLDPPQRCTLVILSMLLFNLGHVMPLFCTALFVPVLGTLCAVLGDQRTVVDTSTLLVGNVFNNTSFMILGALVINGIFTKCGLERRFMRALLTYFDLNGPWFLLALIMGGTLLCSVLYSGSMVLIIAVKSELKDGLRARTVPANVAKRILLGAAICANAGAILLPISSVLTLIAISLLGDFGFVVSTSSWLAISTPIVFITMFGSWILLLIAFPSETRSAGAGGPTGTTYESEAQEMEDAEQIEITDWHLIFLGVGAIATVAIMLYSEQMEPWIGNPACVSLLVVVIVFGSGFMSRDEFCSLDWDILALVGGTNVVALMVRETGLGLALADAMIENNTMEKLPFHGLLGIAVCMAMVAATYLQHSITSVLTMPLLVAIGIKLQAAESMTLLVAMGIPFGMGLQHSSFDNMFSQRTSYELGTKRAWLTNKDWRIGGGGTGVIAWCVIMSIGYHICFTVYELPPPVWVVEHHIPKELIPQVVKENFRFKFAASNSNSTSTSTWQFPWTPSYATAINGSNVPITLMRPKDIKSRSDVSGSSAFLALASPHSAQQQQQQQQQQREEEEEEEEDERQAQANSTAALTPPPSPLAAQNLSGRKSSEIPGISLGTRQFLGKNSSESSESMGTRPPRRLGPDDFEGMQQAGRQRKQRR